MKSFTQKTNLISSANFKFLACVAVLFAVHSTVVAQFFTQPGPLFYSLNQKRQVMDISADGRIAIVLKNDPISVHPAFLTTFDPIFGSEMDNITFGFGPLHVQLAQVGNQLRAVVLTSEGGPRTIYLFDVSPTGKLTQIASTRLTDDISDGGSNLALSGAGQAGFVVVFTPAGADLVTFSLVDGTVLNRLPVGGPPSTLVLHESPNKRLLAFRLGSVLRVVDCLNPSQPSVIANVTLTRNSEFSASAEDGIAFSGDGRFVFVANQFYEFAVVDLTTQQVVSTISGDYRFSKLRLVENGPIRWLVVKSSPAGTGGVSALLLVDASDPFHLSIVNQLSVSNLEGFTDFDLSANGSRLFQLDQTKLTAFNLPSFEKVWEKFVPTSSSSTPTAMQILVWGQPDEIIGSWEVSGGLGFLTMLGLFPTNQPDISVNDVTVAEGDSGSISANFTVSLSAPSNHRINVSYATADATAVKDLDYVPISGVLTYEPGEISKQLSVSVLGDISDEIDETFKLNLTNTGVGLLTRPAAIVSISDDDLPPQGTIANSSFNEGNVGSTNAVFVVSLSAPSGKTISINYVTSDGTALAGSDYTSSSGTLQINPGETSKNILVPITGDRIVEADEVFSISLSNPVNVTLANLQAQATIRNDDATMQLTGNTFEVNEGAGSLVVTVTRIGFTGGFSNVSYRTVDDLSEVRCDVVNGTSYARCDYATSIDTIIFGPGETSKTFSIPIIDDAFAEGNETFTVALTGAASATVGTPDSAIVTIIDNETSNGPNPIFATPFFVRQHYLDFLSREPEAGEPWSAVLNNCSDVNNNPACDRLTVSAAFFGSPEFQLKGYFAFRFYRLAFGRLPLYSEIVADMRAVTGQTPDEVFQKKALFAFRFVTRPEFGSIYGPMPNSSFVNALMGRYALTQITTPDPTMPDGTIKVTLTTADLITRLNTGQLSRAQVLRAIADSDQVFNIEFNRAFVAMQYYGYLRRTPEQGGFDAWLNYLNANPNDSRTMINGFMNSTEYRLRFGPPTP